MVHQIHPGLNYRCQQQQEHACQIVVDNAKRNPILQNALLSFLCVWQSHPTA
jgi:hypothetical protein